MALVQLMLKVLGKLISLGQLVLGSNPFILLDCQLVLCVLHLSPVLDCGFLQGVKDGHEGLAGGVIFGQVLQELRRVLLYAPCLELVAKGVDTLQVTGNVFAPGNLLVRHGSGWGFDRRGVRTQVNGLGFQRISMRAAGFL